MNFSLTASMGFLRTPIRGFVLVADHDLTIDVDLGLLANVIPESAVRSKIEARIRGLIGS
jgi:hypothetical protein